jgi:hypothetical protein
MGFEVSLILEMVAQRRMNGSTLCEDEAPKAFVFCGQEWRNIAVLRFEEAVKAIARRRVHDDESIRAVVGNAGDLVLVFCHGDFSGV